MRKFFEGLSLAELALFFSSLILGIFLRFYDLGSLSGWTDELATWFYARNLNIIFSFESHTPFYYGVVRLLTGSEATLESIRLLSASISVLSLAAVFFLSIKIMDAGRLVLMMIILSLNPLDIAYARMARHYSIFFELVLIFLILMRRDSKILWLAMLGVVLGFLHIFSLIPLTLIFLLDYWERRDLKRLLILTASSYTVLIYYAAKAYHVLHLDFPLAILSLAAQKAASVVKWNDLDFWSFQKMTLTQFLGDYFPKSVFYPVPLTLATVVILSALIFVLIRRKQSAFMLVAVWITTIVFIEFMNLWGINFRIPRLVVYLAAFLILAIIDAIPKVKLWHQVTALGLMVLFLVNYNPLVLFPWEDKVITEWNKLREENKDIATFVCANPYQSSYHKLYTHVPCVEKLDSVNLSRPLLFLDMNNRDEGVMLFLMDKMTPAELHKFPHSRIIRFEPR